MKADQDSARSDRVIQLELKVFTDHAMVDRGLIFRYINIK